MADPIIFNFSKARLVFWFGKGKKNIFIIHGHDHNSRDELVRFLRELGLNPIVLDEQPSQGLTIIEKFERHAKNASLAIGLLTADDMGHPKAAPERSKPRARQNVVFELGFFVGQLGRQRVIAIRDEDVEVPSDYKGVVYISRAGDSLWKIQLAQELENAGLPLRDVYETLRRSRVAILRAVPVKSPKRRRRG